MPRWSVQFSDKATELSARPVYVLVIAHSTTMFDQTVLVDGTTFWAEQTDGFEPLIPGPLFVWDEDQFEIAHCHSEGTFGGWQTLYVDRGQYGTYAQAWAVGRTILSPQAIFSTGTVTGTDLDIRTGLMHMPSGCSQTLKMVEGQLRTDNILVNVNDQDGRVTKLFGSSYPIGKMAILMGGYEGMDFTHYSFLHVGRVASVGIQDGGVYEFEIEDVTRRLSKKLFQHVADYTDTTNGSMTNSQTTIPLTNETLVPNTDDHPTRYRDGVWSYAAYYLKVDSEWMRVKSNTGGTCTVARGQLGTTAVSHSTAKTVDMCIVFEDNPIDLLLGFLISANRSYATPADDGQEGTYELSWNQVGDSSFGNVGLAIPISEINVTSFETIRDRWYADYVWRVYIDRAEQMKPFIEKYILKPLGLCLYVNRAGELSLAIARPPLPGSDTVTTLDSSSIIGTPSVSMDGSEIINEVIFSNYDFDYATQSYGGGGTIIKDETSQIRYDTQNILEIDARGMCSAWNATGLMPRIGRKKMRPYINPNPRITLEVLMSNVNVDPGEVVQVTLNNMPDMLNGTVGWDKYMLVTGKRVRWDRGTLELEVLDSTYWGQRYGLISPSGTVDYDSATDAVKDTYCFLSDANDLMSDGTDSYLVI